MIEKSVPPPLPWASPASTSAFPFARSGPARRSEGIAPRPRVSPLARPEGHSRRGPDRSAATRLFRATSRVLGAGLAFLLFQK